MQSKSEMAWACLWLLEGKMTSKEIVDAVTSYVRDENAKYAILIDGAWGSGKTYFWNNKLKELNT